MNYRKIWESVYGPIPKGYEIHHKDGNRNNNDLSNLQCVSTEEHYKIHYEQGDYMACSIIATRMNLTHQQKMNIHKKAMMKRDQTGEKNPMYGRSAIKENNMKWYNNGKISKMFVENTQPKNWSKGRLLNIQYNKFGSNNPNAKKVKVNDKIYECLKDAANELNINYSTLKGIAKKGYSKKFEIQGVEYI